VANAKIGAIDDENASGDLLHLPSIKALIALCIVLSTLGFF